MIYRLCKLVNALLLPVALAVTTASGITAQNWEHINPGLPGLNNWAGGGVYYQGKFVVIGSFTTIGSHAIHNAAAWNGKDWEPLGDAIDSSISAVVLNPATSRLLFAGTFHALNGESSPKLAEWDGKSWKAVAPGLEWVPYEIAVDSKGGIYASGYSEKTYPIMYWDKSKWKQIGESDLPCERILIDTQDNLIVGGSFTSISGTSYSGLARWNGSSWESIGSGLTIQAKAMDFDKAGNLYVAGFASISGTSGSYGTVVRWNGKTWTNQTNGDYWQANAVCIDSMDQIYIGGNYSTSETESLSVAVVREGKLYNVAKNQPVTSVSAIFCKKGPPVAMGSGDDFYTPNGIGGLGISILKGDSWHSFTPGLDGEVTVLQTLKDGRLILGGEFRGYGDQRMNGIAQWDEKSFQALGDGIKGLIFDIAEDSSGNVVVAGRTMAAGGTLAQGIASWNGSQWKLLGPSITADVDKLVVGSSGMLYASGDFTAIGATSIKGFAQWDGNTWSAVPGWNYTDWKTPSAFAVDAKGVLYVSADGWIYTLKKGTWTQFGTKRLSPLIAMEFDSKGTLYVATLSNAFSWNATTNEFDNIMQTSLPSTSSQLNPAKNRSMVVDSNQRLILGGYFDWTSAFGPSTLSKMVNKNLAIWGADGLDSTGATFDGIVYDLAVLSKNRIAVAGSFTKTGNMASPFLALFYTDGTAPIRYIQEPQRLQNGVPRLRFVGSEVLAEPGAGKPAYQMNGRISH